MTAEPVFQPLEPLDGDAQKSGVHPNVLCETEPRAPRGEATDTESAAADRRAEERSLHLRTHFLRRVAHDIASPTGVAMTVLEELAADSKRPDLVAMGRRGVRRLLRLSEQLALLADLEAGDVTPDTALEDVRPLVKDALDAAVAIDGRRDIVTALRLPDAPVPAIVDRRLLGSVFREVIGNALRLASSTIAVDVKTIMDSPDGDRSVVVRVQDDGCGFSEESLATLGRRFTNRSCVRGLGLSLSMAKDILDAHGGAFRVEQSTLPPGRRGARGAAVLITLPMA